MGIAIQYCVFCQEQIPPKDVAEGRAVQRPGGYICVGCAKKAGLQNETPSPSTHRTPSPRRPASVPPSRLAGHPTPPPISREPHAAHVPHGAHGAHVPPKRSPTPVILGGIGLVIGILLLVIMGTRGSDAPKPTSSSAVEPPPDPRIAQIKLALANARDIDPSRFDEAISAFRAAAKIYPDSAWAREAEAEAKAIEATRDGEARKEFERIQEEAENWEKDGLFAGAIEAWKAFPQRLLGGDWGRKVDEEKKAIEGRKQAFEKEAEDLARDVLRQAAAHADAREYEKAIQALETYPARFKTTKWAAEVAQAKSRYQEASGAAVKRETGALDQAVEKCTEALLAGDVAGARKAWEALLGGAHAAVAKSELEDLADIETDRERDGVAVWFRGTRIVVIPKSATAWKGNTKAPIRLAGTADLEDDGKREIFIGLDGNHDDPGFIFCMDLEGAKKWQFGTSARHWDGEHLTPKMSVVGLKIADLDGDGKKEVISVSNHIKYFPCRVCVISWEGKLVSEYWNPGHGGAPFAADIDGDGKPEVLISFVNNDKNMAQVVACFKGTNIRGTAPPNGKDGSQLWYTEVPGARPPMSRITWRRERKDGPVTRIECEFQDGIWVLGPDGKVIQKP